MKARCGKSACSKTNNSARVSVVEDVNDRLDVAVVPSHQVYDYRMRCGKDGGNFGTDVSYDEPVDGKIPSAEVEERHSPSGALFRSAL